MNVRSAGKPSVRDTALNHIREYTLGRNPINVTNVTTPSVRHHPFIDMWEGTGGRPV